MEPSDDICVAPVVVQVDAILYAADRKLINMTDGHKIIDLLFVPENLYKLSNN